MNKYVDISNLSTMHIGGKAHSLIKLKKEKDIEKILNFCKTQKRKILVLGEGSNTIFNDKYLNYIVLKIDIKNIKIKKETKNYKIIEVGAGLNWDRFVNFTIKNNLQGIEALSGIPGTVGASPIQNIGAYGSEVKNNIHYVLVYDKIFNKIVKLNKNECHFSYRNSLFKNNKNRYIILKVFFKLFKNKEIKIPKYKDVENFFLNKQGSSLQEIRNAIIKIRKEKLPNPKIIPNCGSFFKNPIITKNDFKKLQKKLPTIPYFKVKEKIKIPAGFLIETAKFKGVKINEIEIYKKNALVLTNPNKKASFKNLIKVKNKISQTIYKKFGVRLESEVNIIYK